MIKYNLFEIKSGSIILNIMPEGILLLYDYNTGENTVIDAYDIEYKKYGKGKNGEINIAICQLYYELEDHYLTGSVFNHFENIKKILNQVDADLFIFPEYSFSFSGSSKEQEDAFAEIQKIVDDKNIAVVGGSYLKTDGDTKKNICPVFLPDKNRKEYAKILLHKTEIDNGLQSGLDDFDINNNIIKTDVGNFLVLLSYDFVGMEDSREIRTYTVNYIINQLINSKTKIAGILVPGFTYLLTRTYELANRYLNSFGNLKYAKETSKLSLEINDGEYQNLSKDEKECYLQNEPVSEGQSGRYLLSKAYLDNKIEEDSPDDNESPIVSPEDLQFVAIANCASFLPPEIKGSHGHANHIQLIYVDNKIVKQFYINDETTDTMTLQIDKLEEVKDYLAIKSHLLSSLFFSGGSGLFYKHVPGDCHSKDIVSIDYLIDDNHYKNWKMRIAEIFIKECNYMLNTDKVKVLDTGFRPLYGFANNEPGIEKARFALNDREEYVMVFKHNNTKSNLPFNERVKDVFWLNAPVLPVKKLNKYHYTNLEQILDNPVDLATINKKTEQERPEIKYSNK